MTPDHGAHLAEAALDFVGVPFRLYGRDPAVGLDCIGLVAASLAAIGRKPCVPAGYRLRNSNIEQWLGDAHRSSLARSDGPTLTGDVLLTASGPAQHHLMIALSGSWVIHAHAGLRRVVTQPLPPTLRPLRQWRLTVHYEEI